MSQATARRLVAVSLLIMASSVAVRRLLSRGIVEGSTYRQLWAIAATGLVLAVLADFAPTVAGPLAVLAAVTTLAGGGRVPEAGFRALARQATGRG